MKLHKRLLTASLLAGVLAISLAVTAFAAEKLVAPSDIYWKEKGIVAQWEEVEDASKYEVRLYRDDTYVSGSEVDTKKTSYNFKSKIKSEGYYTFRVRAIAKNKKFTSSGWSDYSEEMLITQAEIDEWAKLSDAAKEQAKENVNTGGSGPGDGAGWKSNQSGSWYQRTDSSYPVNQWEQIGGVWYYFNAEGYLYTGWLTTAEGKTYYLQPSNGAMVTGSQTIDGTGYNFEDSGALIP